MGKKKKSQCSVLEGGNKPNFVKVPQVTENQLPHTDTLQTKAASAFLQFSQDSGNCKTKAHYEVTASNQPIKDRDDPQKQFSHSCVDNPLCLNY